MKTIYLYLNNLNQAVYCNFNDSEVNKSNPSLRKYVFNSEKNLSLFIIKYGIRLHPESLLNVITDYKINIKV